MCWVCQGSLDCDHDIDTTVMPTCKGSFQLRCSNHLVTYTLMLPCRQEAAPLALNWQQN